MAGGAAQSAATRARNVEMSLARTSHRAFIADGAGIEASELLSRFVREESVESGVDLQSGFELTPGALPVAELFGDHSCVKMQQRVACAVAQRLVDGVVGFSGLTILEERPGEGVPGVDVVADFELLPGKRE